MAIKCRHSSVRLIALLVVASIAIATASTETDANAPNWVSPVNAAESACYRKTYLSSKTCVTGYESDDVATCWAQCPLNYPVECGMECIPQSSDCTLEVLTKVKSVATVALSAATSGVFGELLKASQVIQLGVKCGLKLFTATRSLVSYIDELQANETQSQQLLSLVNQSDLVVNEVPTAVCTCLGIPVNTDNLELRAQITKTVTQIVTTAVEDGTSLLNPSNFLAFIKDLGVDDSVKDLDKDSLTQLQDIMTSGASCGTKLLTIIHKVTQFVADIKSGDPTAAVSSIRQALSVSELFVTDIPAVTNNCIRNLTDDAFSTRDSLRTVMSTIIDGLIDGAMDDEGKSISTSDYLAKVADMGLDVIAMFDSTGIAAMMSTFIQPICGPTTFLGEIDNGSLDDALALTTKDYVFNGSYGTWSKSGDGSVTIIFESSDTKDVTVQIHSGGDTVAKVKVGSGKSVYWNSTVKELQDKTLYLDRWRVGLLGVPSSAGGSLLMWVPHASEGGKIELHAKIHGNDGDASNSSGGSEESIDQNEESQGTNEDDSATPAPTIPKGDDKTDQSQMSSSGSEENMGISTPAPTTLDNEVPTQHSSKDLYCQG